ncbi:MAG: transcription elongation factor GreA [Planctomycetes bacterium]|nr:transcription elongation factor GreA [Planctomycetota bacterium]
MHNLVQISQTGFKNLKKELSKLEKERIEVAKRVGEARQQGDLRENGEYIYGRQQLGFIDGRLGELRTQINCSEIVDCTTVECDKAMFGTIVTLLDMDTQEKVTYQLLGPYDADIHDDGISIQSPVGDAIVGLSVGGKESVTIPRGEFNFEVVDIAKSQIK